MKKKKEIIMEIDFGAGDCPVYGSKKEIAEYLELMAKKYLENIVRLHTKNGKSLSLSLDVQINKKY